MEKYELTQNKRIELQKSIEEQMNILNKTISAENELLIARKNIRTDAEKRDVDNERINSCAQQCLLLLDEYNNFMEINQKHIKKCNLYFRTEWNKLENKWYEWSVDDIIGWFKHKLESKNTSHIKWDKIKNELDKQNICGESLNDFTENALYTIGIHDFGIRNYIYKCIAVLKSKYPLQKNENDNNNDDNDKKIPEKFICPITKQIMKDPVIAF
eukprot:110931_1